MRNIRMKKWNDLQCAANRAAYRGSAIIYLNCSASRPSNPNSSSSSSSSSPSISPTGGPAASGCLLWPAPPAPLRSFSYCFCTLMRVSSGASSSSSSTSIFYAALNPCMAPPFRLWFCIIIMPGGPSVLTLLCYCDPACSDSSNSYCCCPRLL